MERHIDVVAAVIVRNGRIFCAQRGEGGEASRKWEFPGGKIEPNELPREALVREIEEELSATIEVLERLATVEYRHHLCDITMHAFRCRLTEDSLTLNEHLDARWLEPDELDGVDWAEADRMVVETVKNRFGRLSRTGKN